MTATKQRRPAGPVLYVLCWIGVVWAGLTLLGIPNVVRSYAQNKGGALETLAGMIIVWLIGVFCILAIRDTQRARRELAAQSKGSGQE